MLRFRKGVDTMNKITQAVTNGMTPGFDRPDTIRTRFYPKSSIASFGRYVRALKALGWTEFKHGWGVNTWTP